ncbi:hypothetical protein [Nisaea sp.]|uniref:hypothetical protein n=1 Tax=Nisaea sp. TaxID=2024842 RepID=UPI002B273995|nr:hypothetical protein [Nisaea sp.]
MRIAKSLLVPAVLVVAVVFSIPASAFDIYRGVSAKNNGNASLGPGSFAFGKNGDLSTFDIGNLPRNPCFVKITLANVPNKPPQVNDTGDVQGLVNNYQAVFDNNPPGHWNIQLGGVNPNTAKNDFSNWAKNNRGMVIVNGAQNNCY